MGAYARKLALITAAATLLMSGYRPRPVVAADAGELVNEGITARRKGDDARALEKFQEAYRLQETPRTLTQMALAEQALGRWVAAHDHLVAALAARDAWIAKNRGTLSEALTAIEEHVGKLEILGPAGTDVRVDGVAAGKLPLAAPLTIATGTVTIELSASGFYPAQRRTVVRAGYVSRESFETLAPLTPPAPRPPAGDPVVPTAQPASGGPAAEPPESHDQTTRAPDAPAPSSLRASAKWIAGGLALGALAGGTVAYLLHVGAADEFKADCVLDSAERPIPKPGAMVMDQTCRDRRDRVDNDYRLSIAGFAASAAFAAAGLVLWLTEPKEAETGAASVGCIPMSAPRTLAFSCSLRF